MTDIRALAERIKEQGEIGPQWGDRCGDPIDLNAICHVQAATLATAYLTLLQRHERLREALETIQRRGSYTRHHHGFEMVESESEDAKIARAALGEGGRG